MKFKTSDLIARIDDLIAERFKLADEKHVEDVAAHQSFRAQWLEDHGPAYVEFANRIKEKIRKGRPITQDDLPAGVIGRYREFETFKSANPPTKKVPQTGDLTVLKAALSAVSDEYVTTTGLREVGFKDISRLFGGGVK